MMGTMWKEHFLYNYKNDASNGKLEHERFLVKLAVEDADRLVVSTAIDIAQMSESGGNC